MARGCVALSLALALLLATGASGLTRDGGKAGGGDFLSDLVAKAAEVRARHAAHRAMMAGQGEEKVVEAHFDRQQPHVAQDTTGLAGCPQGSIEHMLDGNMCAWRPSEAADWRSAEELCRTSGGGHLASFANAQELFFVQSLVSQHSSFWIGMQRTPGAHDDGGKHWKFTDGTSPHFASRLWAPGEPNDLSARERCAELVAWAGTGETNRINEAGCGERRPYLCMRPAYRH